MVAGEKHQQQDHNEENAKYGSHFRGHDCAPVLTTLDGKSTSMARAAKTKISQDDRSGCASLFAMCASRTRKNFRNHARQAKSGVMLRGKYLYPRPLNRCALCRPDK
jgi:hypothetical protein